MLALFLHATCATFGLFTCKLFPQNPIPAPSDLRPPLLPHPTGARSLLLVGPLLLLAKNPRCSKPPPLLPPPTGDSSSTRAARSPRLFFLLRRFLLQPRCSKRRRALLSSPFARRRALCSPLPLLAAAPSARLSLSSPLVAAPSPPISQLDERADDVVASRPERARRRRRLPVLIAAVATSRHLHLGFRVSNPKSQKRLLGQDRSNSSQLCTPYQLPMQELEARISIGCYVLHLGHGIHLRHASGK
ncbi:uncharacterized protein LOC141826089 [Curcuma longa]|uniref:uncharacterized protein LOC141826089 n=1 Tax=Curcuma longa TaxID=136217 RepID=UPI003D9DF8BB